MMPQDNTNTGWVHNDYMLDKKKRKLILDVCAEEYDGLVRRAAYLLNQNHLNSISVDTLIISTILKHNHNVQLNHQPNMSLKS